MSLSQPVAPPSATGATQAPSGSTLPSVSLYGSTSAGTRNLNDWSQASLTGQHVQGMQVDQRHSSLVNPAGLNVTAGSSAAGGGLNTALPPSVGVTPGGGIQSSLSINNASPAFGAHGSGSVSNTAHMEAINQLNSEREKIQQLLEQVRTHETHIHQQTLTLEKMKEDYRHNLRVLESRDAELRELVDQRDVAENQITGLQAELNTVEGKVDALRGTIEESEAAHLEDTKSLREELDATKARVTILLSEKADLQKGISEYELEVAQMREDHQHQRAQFTRQLEAEKRKYQQECEEQIEQEHRNTLMKEEQIHAEKKRLETRTAEIHSELSRLKDTQLSTEMQREEYQKLAAGRESTINHLQQQINDLRRSSKQREADLETEIASLRAAREQAERNSVTHNVTIARDLDKKAHEVELLEQKVNSMRVQYDAEMKRKHDLHDDQVRGLEEKLYVAEGKIRALESKCSEQAVNLDRLNRQATDFKKDQDANHQSSIIHAQTIEDLERGLKRRDTLLEKAHNDVKKLTNLLHEKEKEVSITRTEISRREEHDRANVEKVLSLKERKWQREFSADQQAGGEEYSDEEFEESVAAQDRSVVGGIAAAASRRTVSDYSRVERGASLMASPVAADVSAARSRPRSRAGSRNQSRNVSPARHSSPRAGDVSVQQQNMTIELLQDIKGQLAQQKEAQVTMMDTTAAAIRETSRAQSPQNNNQSGINVSGTDLYVSNLDQSHAVSRATTAQLRRELAVMRENHANDREELEEKLSDAVKEIAREKKRTERLQTKVNSSIASAAAVDLSSGVSTPVSPAPPGRGTAAPNAVAHAQRLEQLRQQFAQPPPV